MDQSIRHNNTFSKIVFALLSIASLIVVIGLLYIVMAGQTQDATETDPETVLDPALAQEVRNYEIVDNGDGTHSALYGVGPIQYLTNNPGEYAAIDSTIVESAREGVAYENTTNVINTFFGSDVTDPNFISYQIPGERGVGFTFPDAQQSAWAVAENVATYPELYPGMDARYTIQNDVMLEELIVDNKEDASNFHRLDQQVTLHDVYFREQDDGSITFHDADTRHAVFVIPRPVLYEDGDTLRQNANYGLHFEISRTDTDTYLISKVIDDGGKEWLEKADYPIIIDNTYIGGFNAAVGSTKRYKRIGGASWSWSIMMDSGIYGYPFITTGKYTNGCSLGNSSCIQHEYHGHYTFHTYDVGAPYTQDQVVGARFQVSMVRSDDDGEYLAPVNVYSGANAWDPNKSFSESFTAAEIEDRWNALTSMHQEVDIDTAGLPTYTNRGMCYPGSSPEQCRRVVDIDLNSIGMTSSQDHTQIMLDAPSASYLNCGGSSCNDFHGVISWRPVSSTDMPYPKLEVIYYPDPTIRVDPMAIPEGEKKMEIQIDDDFTDDSSYKLERSFDGSGGPWTEVCSNIATGASGTCQSGITYDCTGITEAGTSGYCTVTDDISVSGGGPRYSDKHTWYRARVVGTSGYVSDYSPVAHDYTFAYPYPEAPPNSDSSESWDKIKIWAPGSGNEYSNQGSFLTIDPEPTKYCMATYTPSMLGWYNPPTNDWRYHHHSSAAYSDVWNEYSEGTYDGRDYINNNDGDNLACKTMAQWIYFGGYPYYSIGEVEDSYRLRPNTYYAFSFLSQNTRDGTVNSPIVMPEYAQTRARVPSKPIQNNGITTQNALGLALDSTPQYAPTEYVNDPNGNTTYAMYVEELNRYFNSDTGTLSSSAVWRRESDWGGAGGIAYGGFAPGTCYSIKAKSRNGASIEGETPARIWSDTGQYCTKMAVPSLSVACQYTDADDDYNCDITLDANGNPAGTEYKFEYCLPESGSNCSAGSGDWQEILIGGKEWNSYNHGDSINVSENTPGYSFLNCEDANMKQMFRGYARRNSSSPSTDPSPAAEDTLPPCQPWSLGHANNPQYSKIQWQWWAPIAADYTGNPVHHYNVYEPTYLARHCDAGNASDLYCDNPFDVQIDDSCSGPFCLFSYTQEQYQRIPKFDNNTQYSTKVRAADSRGRSGRPSAEAWAYTAIETPTGITFDDVQTDTIALNGDGTFSNFSIGSTGLQFQETTSHNGGGADSGELGFTPSGWLSNGQSTTDKGLDQNTKYCYQVRARNAEGHLSGPGDITGFVPASAECRYTLAGTPNMPILERIDGETINITVRDTDDNPHGSPTDNGGETQYALCITKFDDDNVVEFEKYVRPDGTIDYAGVDCASGNGTGYWQSYDGWGNTAGVTIGSLEASARYDFKFKARNGDHIENGADSSGCTANETCIETTFGPEATLFLVKNNVVGWAWSSNSGWISLNCLNQFYAGDQYSCDSADDWGLNTDFVEGRDVNPIEGYAWSASGRAIDKVWTGSNILVDYALPSRVQHSARAGSFIWATAGDALLRIDAASGVEYTCVGSAELSNDWERCTFGDDLRDIVYDGTYLWVSSYNDSIIYQVNPVDGTVAAVDSGSIQLQGLTTTPQGITYDGTYLWVTDPTNDRVLQVDPAAGSEVDQIDVGDQPQYPYYDGKYIWVANAGETHSGQVSRISVADNTVTSIDLSNDNAYDISSDNEHIWISHANTEVITIISPDGSDQATINTDGADSRGIAYADGYIWAADQDADTIYQIDIVSRDVVAEHEVGGNYDPLHMSIDDAYIWASTDDGEVGGQYIALQRLETGVSPDKVGLGWLTYSRGVCSDNAQKPCDPDRNTCGGTATCEPAAGLPPDSTAYGYCYTDGTPDERYGLCSVNTGAVCTDSIACPDPEETCIYHTCQTGDTCPDYGSGTEVCVAMATTNFDGLTREVRGYGRSLTMAQRGAALGFDDWGWISMDGTYTDEADAVARYGVTATDVDSQLFLGDPDVNPDDVILYSLFGWGWNAEVSDFGPVSTWLNPLNVSNTKKVNHSAGWPVTESSIAIDSTGNPHIAWSQFNENSGFNDIYHVRLIGGQWQMMDGSVYQPGVSEPIVSTVTNSGMPSLAVDSSNIPHLVWQEQEGTEADISGGELQYSTWNSETNTWTAMQQIETSGPSCGGASLVIDEANRPHVAYRVHSYDDSEIYYRYFNGSDWVTASGDTGTTDINVSNTGSPHSYQPRLVLSDETTQRPHIVWREQVGAEYHIYYRHWDGNDWVTASGNTGDTDVSVNGDLGTVLGISIEGANPDIVLYADNRPGIIWRDPGMVLYRQWNGSAWVDANPDDGDTDDDIWINIHEGSDVEHLAHSGKTPRVAIDSDDQPHVVWGDYPSGGDSSGDIRYRWWNASAEAGNGAWVTSSGDYTVSGSHFDDDSLTIHESPNIGSTLPDFTMDALGNPHVIWQDVRYKLNDDAAECAANGDINCICSSHADCGDPDYPFCMTRSPDKYCGAADVKYAGWLPGRVRSGIGWVEFMPVGALIGVPWVQTLYSDIYAQENIGLAPPPRGTGTYTATYLILANGDIQGIPSYYTSSQTGEPTSGYYEPGLESLIEDAGYPVGRDALSQIDVDNLIAANDENNAYGNLVHNYDNSGSSSVNISPDLTSGPLNGEVFYFHDADNGLYQVNDIIRFNKGESQINQTAGHGLVIIDGDLEINSPIYYEKRCNGLAGETICTTNNECDSGEVCRAVELDDVSEMPSVAFIVRGNIYVNSQVNELAGVYVALDPDTTDEVDKGIIYTSRKAPITQTIIASEDDTSVDSAYTNSSSADTVSFGQNSSIAQRGFLRWQLNVPAGAEIRNAYLRLYGDGNGNATDFRARIYLLDTANAEQVSNDFTANPNQSLFDADTSNSVSYDINEDTWDTGGWNTSPDISALVQKFVNEPTYESGNYIGIELREEAGVDGWRGFEAYDAVAANYAELVVEYSPRRTVYSLADIDGDDAPDEQSDYAAWGTGSGTCDQNDDDTTRGPCVYNPLINRFGFGSYSLTTDASRIFFHFGPYDSDYSTIPEQAEILESHVVVSPYSGGDAGFQARQGLLDSAIADFAGFTDNPYELTMSPEVSEIAEEITDSWDSLSIFSFADTSRLIQAWVDLEDYTAGDDIGIRLRKGRNEQIYENEASRTIQTGQSRLEVDYLTPLRVSGLFVARGYSFDRKYTKDLAASEQILYDGRVVANTPPGLSDFTRALPVYARVTP